MVSKMSWFWMVFLVFGLVPKLQCFCEEIPSPRIAIIGGGIGGATASHFLTELFQGNLQIDLFESHKIGGRLATVEVQGQQFESGGSIIHPKNKYMKDFVSLLGLEKRPDSPIDLAGIWTGKKFAFIESEYSVKNFLNLVYRYGLQPFSLNRYINSVLSDFDKIYSLQEIGKSFENVNDLLSAMNSDFPQLLQKSIKSHLLDSGYSARIIDELVQASVVVNYGQEVWNAHSFVGMVSLAGATSGLWSVKGGNYQVPEHLIRKNDKVRVIPCLVEKIRYLGDNSTFQYELFYNTQPNSHGNMLNDSYNIVIIAAPQTTDQENRLAFEHFPENLDLSFSGEYQTTVATFTQAKLNNSHFGLKNSLGAILSCNPNETVINSVSKLSTVLGQKTREVDEPIWKLFSRKPLTETYLSELFPKCQRNVREEIKWKAYPKYTTDYRKDKFILHDFLYFANAIEWAASAMEMSAIGARNVAILAHQHYHEKYNQTMMKSNRQNCEL